MNIHSELLCFICNSDSTICIHICDTERPNSLFSFLPWCSASQPSGGHVRVLWLCLMSRMSGDIQVPSEEVDNYVKLFLSSCNSFLNASKDLKHWDDKDKEDNKKSKKRKRKRRTTYILYDVLVMCDGSAPCFSYVLLALNTFIIFLMIFYHINNCIGVQ